MMTSTCIALAIVIGAAVGDEAAVLSASAPAVEVMPALPRVTDSAPPASQDTEPDSATQTPWLVIGEVIDSVQVRVAPGGGTVFRVCDPPSREDLDRYLVALGSALGIAPIPSVLCEDLVSRFIDSQISLREASMPSIIELSARGAEMQGPETDRSSHLVAMHKAISALMTKQAVDESSLLDAIDQSCSEHGIPLDHRSAQVKQAFVDARWRARASSMGHLAFPARVDVGLVAVDIAGGSDAPELEPVKPVISEYWKAFTPPSRACVPAALETLPRASELMGIIRGNGSDDDRQLAMTELGALRLRRNTPLFERARLNLEWRPRIRQALPEHLREPFDEATRLAMFPNFPPLSNAGRHFARSALDLEDLSPEVRQAIDAMLREHEAAREALIGKVERSLTAWRANELGVTDFSPQDMRFDASGAIDKFHKADDALRVQVRNLLTAEQSNFVTANPPPPPPESKGAVRVPAVPERTPTKNKLE